MNVLKVHLNYKENLSNSIFSPKNKDSWEKMKEHAVSLGASELKWKIRKQFTALMPSADKPLTSKNNDTGKRWKGKLTDVVQKGKIDTYPGEGIVETHVHIKGTRKSGHGDWLGVVYNKGSFLHPGRWGRKKTHAVKGKKGNMQTNKYYRYRGSIQALDFFEKGQAGFDFTTSVDEILKRYIEGLS